MAVRQKATADLIEMLLDVDYVGVTDLDLVLEKGNSRWREHVGPFRIV